MPIFDLFAATSDNNLSARDPFLTDVNWRRIGHANNITAMTGANGWLLATTSNGRLVRRLGLEYEVNWTDIGHALNVVGMAFANGHLFPSSPPIPSGKLFAATRDNNLSARDPVLTDVNWQRIGHANNVVAMAFEVAGS